MIEEFEGFVDRIDGDIAYVTLKSKDGEEFVGDILTQKLVEKGIRERRRFVCRIHYSDEERMELEAVPDKELTPEREKEIAEEVRKALGDIDGPQDDY